MRLYLLIVGAFLLPAFGLPALGVAPAHAFTLSLLLVGAASLFALGYLYGMYEWTEEPRSQFFRMLLDSKTLTTFGMLYIVYALIAVAFEGFDLPVLSPEHRQILVAVITVAFLASTVFYALKSRQIVRGFIRARTEKQKQEGAN